MKKIKSAILSVYNKDGLKKIVKLLIQNNVEIYSTEGTYNYIETLGYSSKKIEDITNFPSILSGRVKTLHPKIFGGILNRNNNENDKKELLTYKIPNFDLVIVDLYAFSETINSNAQHEEIIEKIDIGGISLIRAAAKNYNDVTIIASKEQYNVFNNIMKNQNGKISLPQRKQFATQAFKISSSYDTQIYNYFDSSEKKTNTHQLKYGENPHQKAFFKGDLNNFFTKHNGKELSYNNILDIDAAIHLINEFSEPTFAIIKHNNPCGVASASTIDAAYQIALSSDPISAFGGVLISNNPITKTLATEIHKLFITILIAPKFEPETIEILSQKKNIILLQQNIFAIDAEYQYRSALNGKLYQNNDFIMEKEIIQVTNTKPSETEFNDLIFANKIVKHAKSNAIAIVKDKQLIGIGMGQPSRIDALNQAIEKAHKFKFNLTNSVMSSDAFFPFSDCVKLAHREKISSIINPGGSIRDQDSINYCNSNNISMITTKTRHFKH